MAWRPTAGVGSPSFLSGQTPGWGPWLDELPRVPRTRPLKVTLAERRWWFCFARGWRIQWSIVPEVSEAVVSSGGHRAPALVPTSSGLHPDEHPALEGRYGNSPTPQPGALGCPPLAPACPACAFSAAVASTVHSGWRCNQGAGKVDVYPP